MRVRISDPALLSDLCDYLSRQGCVAVEAGEDEANVLIPGAHSTFEAAVMVMTEIDLWRVKQQPVAVTVDAEA
jgi:hypothetical protein